MILFLATAVWLAIGWLSTRWYKYYIVEYYHVAGSLTLEQTWIGWDEILCLGMALGGPVSPLLEYLNIRGISGRGPEVKLWGWRW